MPVLVLRVPPCWNRANFRPERPREFSQRMKIQPVHGRTDSVREEEQNRQCKYIDVRDILENAHYCHVIVEKHVSQYLCEGLRDKIYIRCRGYFSNPLSELYGNRARSEPRSTMLTASPVTVNNSMVLIRQSTDWTRVVFIFLRGSALPTFAHVTCLPFHRSAGFYCVNPRATLLHLLCSLFLPRGL